MIERSEKTMRPIIINGYFTTEHINGIPRYAMEVVKQLDRYFNRGEIELVIPDRDIDLPELKNISIVKLGGKKENINPNFWGNKLYIKYVKARNGISVNFTGKADYVYNSISMIHDIIPLRNDRFAFRMSYLSHMKLLYAKAKVKIGFILKCLVKRKTAKYIVTVSNDAKKKIQNKLRVDSKRIVVIGNGWEHILDINANRDIDDQRIRPHEYFFTIGNIYPHKNINWIIKEAKKMPNEIFVVAGKLPYSYVSELKSQCSNIIFLGYISDEFMKYLLENSKALLFPSLEEGFGIPPLEALALGVPVIASEIEVLREIYGNTIHYINPLGEAVDLNYILENETLEKASTVLQEHSWKKSGKEWADLICQLRSMCDE